ncbi:bifunctional adenosylcobinamide kinase/adenosylcobinamide-phosphate guanylyltransferase [Dasania sp. GY-MA-18]|uniref:Bifunctional adenosylcobalamin biosynthesis protein n=1 Tax=Dasania phycosphaerae TaxID=2950436 RepID=A0A9J6RLP6_9GAMM|nr:MULTISPECIES: bifunctional adenosylcobinamide kinase/adenosylcobinamide-phosphate guanylyltransferase [Dasania]MCR8922489.1 bifunctional adenosylcobinamide kinase/adenosylcobinamide-phosphate guanylyltransferase [Dasania sp. GY-MA-18]MCZ0864917.1 bifunctional adenosylcobinamide kinase/adenosylcobinamide-phosphate guanylyltransferase [Dasania phycosphaerae]MCZ0868645.1 bifunctional adenosylcobinamide kinase/adenosylcobinamide-phosphate guanylyltransferase [Dasania phycosphaerae]
MKQFVIGGARSGKSSLAETLASACGDNIAYIATANVAFNDGEMDARIAKHQQQRPSHWRTVEAPIALADALTQLQNHDAVMIDCLTLWLSNCLHEGNWPQQRQDFLKALENFNGELIIVSNEVGMGIVPLGELSRSFVDESGFLHQAVAARCERVIFTAAGLPLVMKGPAL